jgi:DUF1680 family protein
VPVLLTQTTEYPFDPAIRIRVQPARPAGFTLRLRIPAWAAQASLAINGAPHPVVAEQGFAAISRTWRPDDTVTLTLPLSLRLENLAANGGPAHPDLVALLHGPIVLFALHEATSVTVPPANAQPYSQPPTPQPAPLSLPREALLAAKRTGPREWTVTTSNQAVRFVPFTELADRSYTTYVSTT